MVAIGSNLGDRSATLRRATRELRALAIEGSFRASRVVETAAMTLHGVDPCRPGYLNQVAEFGTELSPLDLLGAMQAIEDASGRTRTEIWGDRTLDLDLVTYGSRIDSEPRLILPHPRAYERDFVLVPWLQLDPSAELPGHGPVMELVRGLRDVTIFPG